MSRGAFYALALLIFGLDQASKAWLRATLPFGQSMPVIADVFFITHTRNTGAAFSLFQGATLLLAALAIVVIGGLIWVARRAGPTLPLDLGLALALPLGGALGNLLDRLRLSYVTDLFDFRLINFPVFNVADSAITIGMALLTWRTLAARDKTGTPDAAAAEDAPAT